MTVRTGHTLRWSIVWASVILWLVALMFDLGGNAAHLLLVLGMAALVYELLAAEPPPA